MNQTPLNAIRCVPMASSANPSARSNILFPCSGGVSVPKLAINFGNLQITTLQPDAHSKLRRRIFHTMSQSERGHYVRSITAVAAENPELLLFALGPANRLNISAPPQGPILNRRDFTGASRSRYPSTVQQDSRPAMFRNPNCSPVVPIRSDNKDPWSLCRSARHPSLPGQRRTHPRPNEPKRR